MVFPFLRRDSGSGVRDLHGVLREQPVFGPRGVHHQERKSLATDNPLMNSLVKLEGGGWRGGCEDMIILREYIQSRES